ncbi:MULTISPECIES: replication protein A [Natrinema]|uniref:Nucleic acid binding OB-fold tRNA/helicase-type n=1 Tax=Natrinema gari JCM 14663 TaxID=1230459 RepID=L9YYH3_9EURY|nr:MULTISPECIES: replication protein A [Natrinema]AFO59456.1 nucleic acid binding OB-fold tRNA/helicase-type [Natrinema sp. J7-2]ELY77968.1 nucleic acid binding OB-fold tRNA/helicase-type [Natrinema gari JCM 14663]
MSDVRQHADDIHEQFSDHLDVDVEDVEERLTTLVDEYKVPMDEARRSVTNHYLEEAGLEREDISSGDSEAATIEEVDEPEEWIDLTAKVIELWDPRSDSVAQVGLLGDPTGTIKFTKWAKSELPALEEGGVYELRNVVTDEYQGRYSVKLNSTTVIEERDEDLEVGNDTSEIEGALVDMQSGSGLIKRCPEEDCTRVLQNGRCNEHGEGEGEFDLRIKAVVDDGIDAHEVIFDKDATEDLTGLSLEEAKDMAMDALDTTVVADEIRADIVGTYYRIEGPTFGRYVLADDVEELDGPADAEELLIKARSM